MKIIWTFTRVIDNLTHTMPYCECNFCLEYKSNESPDYSVDTAPFHIDFVFSPRFILRRSDDYFTDLRTYLTCHVRMITYRPN